MQRACSFLFFRRLPFPFQYPIGSFQPLLRYEGICAPKSHLHLPCCRYAADSDKGILQRFKRYIGLGKLSKSVRLPIQLVDFFFIHLGSPPFYRYHDLLVISCMSLWKSMSIMMFSLNVSIKLKISLNALKLQN